MKFAVNCFKLLNKNNNFMKVESKPWKNGSSKRNWMMLKDLREMKIHKTIKINKMLQPILNHSVLGRNHKDLKRSVKNKCMLANVKKEE